MILRDRVTILNGPGGTVVAENVRAHVSYLSGTTMASTERALMLSETLRAIVPAGTPWPLGAGYRMVWRGKEYEADGPALPRRRGNRDHHLTIPLKFRSG